MTVTTLLFAKIKQGLLNTLTDSRSEKELEQCVGYIHLLVGLGFVPNTFFVTIRSKSEEFILICRYSLFLEFEFSRSVQFLHFNFKNCVKKKVKAFSGLFDWSM